MSKVCIFYRVKTQFDNLGDAIINRMLIEALSKHADEIKIDASLAPLDFKEQLGINKKNGINPSFFYIKMIFKCLKGENIYYFLNPGGERGGISNSLYLKKMLNNIVLSMLSFIGIKLCVYGVSYESLCKKSV
ncbi:hypothetical protein, partial [Rheinheimera sp.]|uniref:hypothetical protein n=1 Tax=Rheinheimera sp. TaxID=1869214 RepID=UPI0026049BAE